MLMYVQAFDWSRRGKRLTKGEYKQALQVLNMTNTGNRFGMCPLFVGMRVRLTAKLSAKHGIVQDAVGEVQQVIFDEREFLGSGADWREDKNHPARRRGYVRLRYLPKGVLVKFDQCKVNHGFGEGVVNVASYGATWEFVVHDDVSDVRTFDKVPMNRVNAPLAPERVRTVQTAQGMSMDHCVMMLDRPHVKMSYDDWWLHVYVMLSRVRTASRLLVYGLPPRWIFERGPPKFLADGLALLNKRAQADAARFDEFAKDLGFTCEALEASGQGEASARLRGRSSGAPLLRSRSLHGEPGSAPKGRRRRAAAALPRRFSRRWIKCRLNVLGSWRPRFWTCHWSVGGSAPSTVIRRGGHATSRG